MNVQKDVSFIADLPVLTEEERDDAAFRARDLGWSALVRLFDHYSSTQKLSYQKLGQRIKRSRSHVQRWLSSPFNLSIGSLGLLAEGMNADLLISIRPRSAAKFGQNSCHLSDAAAGLLLTRNPSSSSTSPNVLATQRRSDLEPLTGSSLVNLVVVEA